VIGRTTGLPLTCMSWRLLPSASQVSTRSEGCGPSLPSSSASTYLAKRTGHTRHRWKLVELLGEDEPTCGPRRSATVAHETASKAELVSLFAQRADIPPMLWTQMFRRAQSSIDVLAYAALFLHEQEPDLNDHGPR
jgi:hypothetical protein